MMMLSKADIKKCFAPNRYPVRRSSAIAAAILCVALTSIPLQTAAQTAPGKSQDDLKVVVKPGDTLTAIVKRELDNGGAWEQVSRYNKLESPDRLRPGDVVVIPYELLKLRNYATVNFAKGAVVHLSSVSGEKSTIQSGDRVYIGDTLQSGDDGFIALSFNGESQVKVQPNSVILLEMLECRNRKEACVVKVNAKEGELRLEVNNTGFAKPTKFTIETPYASAAVRGTVFDFETRAGNVLGVTAGEVLISLNGESVEVKEGKGTLAGEGRSIQDVIDLLPKPVYKQTNARRYSAEDFIAWETISDAEQYRVTISPASARTNVVAQYTGSEPALNTNFAPGDYVASARAVDRNGLKGFSAEKSFALVSLDESVQPPLFEIELADEILRIKPVVDQRAEIRLGTELQQIDGEERLVDYQAFDINGGNTFEVRVDPTRDLYIVGRGLVDDLGVTRFGSLYEFRKSGR